MKALRIALPLSLLLFGISALAQDSTIPSDSMIVDIITTAMQQVSAPIIAKATFWLSVLMLLQSVITNLKLLLTDSDLPQVFGKFFVSILWFTVCWYVMSNAPDWINKVGTQFFSEFAPNLPSTATILVPVVAMSGALLVVAAAVGVASTTIAQMILYIVIGIAFVGVFFALKLIMLQLELGIIVMMAPFNFAFLGLNALKENGIAPFKALMSLMYRIVIFGVLFGAYGAIGNATALVAQKYSGGDTLAMIKAASSATTLLTLLVSSLVAHLVLVGLLIKSDSIAANLSSGTTSLSGADMTGAAMGGAAAGAAISGVAGSVAGAAGKPVQAMSEFMKDLRSQSTEISNASSVGAGDLSTSAIKPEIPSMSMADSGGTGKTPGVSDNSNSELGPTKGETQELAEASSGSDGTPAPLAGTSGNVTGTVATGAAQPESFGGVPNPVAGETPRDPQRDAAREARRQAKSGGAGTSAGIGGGSGLEKQVGDLVNALSTPKAKTLGDHMSAVHEHMAQEKAATHVSINLNHD